jgi:four helix bundle protein
MEQYLYPFEKLIAYQEAKKLVVLCYRIMNNFPKEERFALCDQLRRAAVSVPSNIAEGVTKASEKEKIHFLEISYGSLMEVYCQFQISQDLGYIDSAQYQEIQKQIYIVAKLISGLRKSFTNHQ